VFQEHVRVKRVQSEAFNFDKADPETSVLQCDFAMAYSCEYQAEVQSALWDRESINLFTAAFYHGNEACKSYLIVTDSQDKGKDAVNTYLKELIRREEQNLKQKLVIFTDGPSAEFKNRFMVKLLVDLSQLLANTCKKVEWKYFATSHSAKSLVRRSVMARGDGVTVQSSSDFAKEASRLMPKVSVVHVTQEDVNKCVKETDPWSDMKEVPGVSQTHFMTCYPNKRVMLYADNIASEAIAEVRYSCNDQVDNGNAMVSSEEPVKECKLGEWVLVKYDEKIYPGEVTGFGFGGSVQVSVMTPAFPGQKWKWPVNKDEILYEKSNVLKKITPPVPVGSRGQFSFNDQVNPLLFLSFYVDK